MSDQSNHLQGALDAVLVKTTPIGDELPVVKGYDFNNGLDYEQLLDKFIDVGFQATHLGRAMNVTNNMIKWRLSDEPLPEDEEEDPSVDRSKIKATIFLGYTSNLISSGLREVIRFLCEHKMVDCIVTTAGGIEEDFIKCLKPTFVSEFNANGAELRKRGLNRIGNLVSMFALVVYSVI